MWRGQRDLVHSCTLEDAGNDKIILRQAEHCEFLELFCPVTYNPVFWLFLFLNVFLLRYKSSFSVSDLSNLDELVNFTLPRSFWLSWFAPFAQARFPSAACIKMLKNVKLWFWLSLLSTDFSLLINQLTNSSKTIVAWITVRILVIWGFSSQRSVKMLNGLQVVFSLRLFCCDAEKVIFLWILNFKICKHFINGEGLFINPNRF